MNYSRMFLLLLWCALLSSTRNICLGMRAKDCTIAVMGTGYVGLVTGTCLSELGHDVICADIDSKKIQALEQGIIPIYEPGLQELVHKNHSAGRLTFSDSPGLAIAQSNIIFIAVGTPSLPSGDADLKAVVSVARTIAKYSASYKLIVIKSTVPVGTARAMRLLLQKLGMPDDLYDIVSNPEFLREGSAIKDFFEPDRIVVGTQSTYARDRMNYVYDAFLRQQVPCVYTDNNSAELIKYASNAFLATKISFINEIANLCDEAQADVADVSRAMGLDPRIGKAFLNPGPGFGGSCFPKDSLALLSIAQRHHIDLNAVQASLITNEAQKKKPVEKLQALMKDSFEGATVALLGLAFKANTDDVRSSPAIETINLLLQHKVNIRAYDPAAMPTMRVLFPDITYCENVLTAVEGADAMIIMTEWPEFKSLPFARIKPLMKRHFIVDARNIIDCDLITSLGFIGDCIGRKALYQ